LRGAGSGKEVGTLCYSGTSMRICALIVVIVFCLLSLGCGPKLQPAVQGEWSNFHNDKDKVTMNARPDAEKPAGEK